MTTMKNSLERLEYALDVYGADRTRWPAPVRLELSQLLAGSPQAQKMLADAEAFDRLLSHAPVPTQLRLDDLAARITAQAERTPRVAATAVVPLPVRKPAEAPWRRHASGIAALAASLMIGIFAGQSQTLSPAVSELASAVGLDGSVIADTQQLARTDEIDVVVDEDLL